MRSGCVQPAANPSTFHFTAATSPANWQTSVGNCSNRTVLKTPQTVPTCKCSLAVCSLQDPTLEQSLAPLLHRCQLASPTIIQQLAAGTWHITNPLRSTLSRTWRGYGSWQRDAIDSTASSRGALLLNIVLSFTAFYTHFVCCDSLHCPFLFHWSLRLTCCRASFNGDAHNDLVLSHVLQSVADDYGKQPRVGFTVIPEPPSIQTDVRAPRHLLVVAAGPICCC